MVIMINWLNMCFIVDAVTDTVRRRPGRASLRLDPTPHFTAYAEGGSRVAAMKRVCSFATTIDSMSMYGLAGDAFALECSLF